MLKINSHFVFCYLDVSNNDPFHLYLKKSDSFFNSISNEIFFNCRLWVQLFTELKTDPIKK